jgi:hypothetical protein
MCRLQNPHTQTVRSAVSNWLYTTLHDCFSRSMLILELTPRLQDCAGLDLPKSVDNELIRRCKMGLLSYTIGESRGVGGQPPRIYRQRFKADDSENTLNTG